MFVQRVQQIEEDKKTKIKNSGTSGTYSFYAQPNADTEIGKNDEVVWVRSKKKGVIWLYKPINAIYSVRSVVKEAFFGEMAVMLYGKENAPKTKLNLDTPGILSKLLSQDRSISCDLYNFINNENVNCNINAKKNLMQSIIFNIIIENRDIRIENIIVRYRRSGEYSTAWQIHNVDYEFVAPNPMLAPLRCTIQDLLKLMFKDYTSFVNYIFSNNLNGLPDDVKWNIHEVNPIKTAVLYTGMFTLGIKQEDFIKSFEETVNKICADNYKIYDHVAEKIEERLKRQKTNIYSQAEVGEQIQQIIARQKSNMRVINQFISEYSAKKNNLQNKLT